MTKGDVSKVLEGFRQELENELLELTHWVHQRIGDVPPEPRFGFPEGWQPTWGAELPQRSFEPDALHPALLEKGAQPVSRDARRRQREAVARASAASEALSPS